MKQKPGGKMFKVFSKSGLSALLLLFTFNTMNSSLIACECYDSYECDRLYVGAFGGGIYSSSTKISQMGTAFFTEAAGGPLAVYARGNTKETSSGFGGVQLGFEWANRPMSIGYSDWTIATAVEMEAYWYSHTKTGHLINPTDRLLEHDFLNSFHMDAGVYIANAVFSLNNSWLGAFAPYLAGGIGAARLGISKATSIQTDPVEDVNHFNSKRSDSSWAFAAQIKAGLRYQIFQSLHFYGEYRYLFLDSSNYILGSTVAPGHAPTSPWNVKVKNLQYNAFVFGIQYDL